jgi:hypothetical protein
MDEDLRLVLVDALRVQALIHNQLGRPGAAERAVQEALELARTMPYPYAEAGLLLSARLCTEQGRLEAAWEALAGAMAIFERLGVQRAGELTQQVLARLGSQA